MCFKKLILILSFIVLNIVALRAQHVSYTETDQGYLMKGDNLLENKEYDKAIVAYEEGIKINPKLFMLWNNMGFAYYKKNDRLSANQCYKEALKLNTKSNLVYANLGQVQFESGNFKDAIISFSKAIELQPKSPYYYLQRGNSYANTGELKKALTDYDKTLQLDDTDLNALNNRARILTHFGEHAKALKDVEVSLGLAPGNINAINAKAYIYLNKKDYHNTIKFMDESIKLDSNDANTYFMRGWAHMESEENLPAAADFRQALKLDKDIAAAWNNLGVIDARAGRYDDAIANIKKAITLENIGLYYMNLTTLYARKRDFKLANNTYAIYLQKKLDFKIEEKEVGFYTSFLEGITSDIPQANYTRALSNIEAAISGYKKMFTTDRQHYLLEMQGFRAYVLEQQGRTREAMDSYLDIIKTDPNQPEIQQGIERLEKVSPKNNLIQISLIAPKSASTIKAAQQQIIGKIKNSEKVSRLTVNGEVAEIEDDGIFTATIPITIGSNTIEILAKTETNQVVSQKFTLTGDKGISKAELERQEEISPVDLSSSKYHAIIIAEELYQDKRFISLKGPYQDALKLQEILTKSYGFEPENVLFLKDKNRDEIMEVIRIKCEALTRKDNLLIFYAGHGSSETDKQGKTYGYMIPSSAIKGSVTTYIPYSLIYTSMAKSESKHIILIADACSSGAESRNRGEDNNEYTAKLEERQSRTMMASGEKEVPETSIFFRFLLDRLKQNKKTQLRAGALFETIVDAVSHNSNTVPDYRAIKDVGDQGGDFIFTKSGENE